MWRLCSFRPSPSESLPSKRSSANERGSAHCAPLRRVVVVDDDESAVQFFEFLLHRAGFEVTAASSVATALLAARVGFAVMLLDVRLGYEDGLDVLRTLRAEGIPGKVIVITGFDLDGIEEQAHRMGAEFVDRWTLPDPVELVRRSLSKIRLPDERPAQNPVMTPPVLTRWADAVARGTAAADEPKTVSAWARAIYMSTVSLRALCAIARISPRRSCMLVRILRAAHLAQRSGRMNVSEWLDVGDERTLEHLLAVAGVQPGAAVSMEEVLSRQRLVVNDAAIGLLSRALRTRGFLGDDASSNRKC